MSKERILLGGNDSSLNYQMSVLSVIAIIFVIFGHIYNGQYAIGTFYNWFPYYSFHLPIFLFISGYFFKDPEAHDSQDRYGDLKVLGSFFIKKCKRLLLPYFMINGIFLLLNNYLIQHHFSFPAAFSVKTWLVEPFTKCYVLTHALPTWYLIGLFFAYIFIVVIRKLCIFIFKNEPIREVVIFVLCMLISVFAIQYSRDSLREEWLINICRSCAMLFFIQFGIIYRKYLEKKDCMPGKWYFMILFFIQLFIIILAGNDTISPYLYNMSNFGIFGYDYFICGLTGILFWLRIARIISDLPYRSQTMIFIGNNTKYIMSFHLFGVFLLNMLFRCIKLNNSNLAMVADFNDRKFHTYFYYYLNDPRSILLYFFAGLAVSLLFAKIIDSIIRKLTSVYFHV